MPKRKHGLLHCAADQKPATRDAALLDVNDKRGVLVVESDHLVRCLLQLGLERDGFDVWVACSGREAIDVYRAHRDSIAVVLLAVRPRDQDGLATLDAMRCLTPDVVVCIVNSSAADYGSEELRQRGAAHVVAKPFHLNSLADTLRQLMRGIPAEPLGRGEACEECASR